MAELKVGVNDLQYVLREMAIQSAETLAKLEEVLAREQADDEDMMRIKSAARDLKHQIQAMTKYADAKDASNG